MGRSAPSTDQLLGDAQQLARTAAGANAEKPGRAKGGPLVPVSVWVDKGADGEVQEHLLYKLGDKVWESKAAAQRMAWTLGVQQAHEQPLEDDFNRATRTYARHASEGVTGVGERVRIQVCLHKGGLVLRDEPTFLEPPGGVSGVAQSYAACVCRDLGLGADWHNLLVAHVTTLLRAKEARLPPDPSSSQGAAYPVLMEVTPELAEQASVWERLYQQQQVPAQGGLR